MSNKPNDLFFIVITTCTAYTILWKYFPNYNCNFREKMWNRSHKLMYSLPRFNPWLLKNWAKSEVTFWYHPENKWPTPHGMELSVCLVRSRVRRYFLNKDACKNMSGAQHKKLWWFGKRFHNLLRFHNDSRNMFVNTNVENGFFFLIMLPKHVHMGWKLQGKLKSIISFILIL